MRKFFFFLILLAIGLSYAFKLDVAIANKLTFLNDFKIYYLQKVANISFSIDKYFTQLNTIQTLKTENIQLKKYELLHNQASQKLNELSNISENIKEDLNSNTTLTNVISYENYNDYTKVILNYEKQSEDISALITTENFAAGIAIKDKDQTFGLLNGNKKCSYAVFIGDLKVPGIVNYSNERQEYVFLNYIPIWQEINIGDEVITSGMDNVFYEGVKVGKIVEIEKYPTMQKAYVKPYANILKEKYYFVYTNKQAQITPISAKP